MSAPAESNEAEGGPTAEEFAQHLLQIRSDVARMEVKMRAAMILKELIASELSPAGNKVMDALENSKVAHWQSGARVRF